MPKERYNRMILHIKNGCTGSLNLSSVQNIISKKKIFHNVSTALSLKSSSGELDFRSRNNCLLFVYFSDNGSVCYLPSTFDNVGSFQTNHFILSLVFFYRFKHRKSDFALQNPCNDDCLIALLCSIVNTEFGETKKCESLKKMFLQAKNNDQ